MTDRADMDAIATRLAAKPRPRDMTERQRREHKRAIDRASAYRRYWLRKAQEGVSVWIGPPMLRFLRDSGLWHEGVSFEQALDSLRSYCAALEAFIAEYDARENQRDTPNGLLAAIRRRIRA